ncbi:hypothetical protein KY362_07440, partial [Candidatus Woesearchaeota archaeon]|nr:hypothetical protein [Candidatus Woesearchaeota archaeon]
MNLQGLGKVEKPEWYVDLAFKRARKVSESVKSQQRRTPHTIRDAELAKIREIRRTLKKHTDIILKAFPSLDTLDEFYQELIRTMLDYALLKKSLGSVRWAQQKVEFFSDNYYNRIKRCHDFKRLTGYSREYYGRISSVMKQI